MNRVEELLKQLCPDGVEFKELNDIAEISNIGVDKKIIKGEKSVMLLNYMDVYRNKHLKKEHLTMQVTASDRKIDECLIKKGDIYITPTSETIDDIGHAGVAIEDVPNGVYSYHIMRLRLNEVNLTTSFFISYLFESNVIQNQISKSAVGITRYGVSKTKFSKFKIPIPPLPIQQEIVSILDKFTQLQAELEAELEERKRQYEYYRDQLLQADEEGMMSSGVKAEWKTLGEVCHKTENIKWSEKLNEDYQYIDLSSVNRDNNTIDETQLINSTNAPSRAQQIVNTEDVIFGTTRPTLKRYSIITSKYHNQICSTGFCVLRANPEVLTPKYLFYTLMTNMFYNYVENNQKGASYPSISNSVVNKFRIPIPPLSEQNRIVEILDKFDTLINDTSIGIPAEIAARRKQYEYYRAKLLDFKECES